MQAQHYSRTEYVLEQPASRLPSSLSQFEEAIGHWRGCRGSDGQSLVDCFQGEAAVEAPGEGAEVAREMFGRDGAVRGQEAVFDVGEHGICPAEGRVSGGGAVGAGNVALVAETRLRDCREIGGHATMAAGGCGSWAAWKRCPKLAPNVPL